MNRRLGKVRTASKVRVQLAWQVDPEPHHRTRDGSLTATPIIAGNLSTGNHWWGGAVARVFVSYASQDRERVGQLHQWLVAEGHEVFLDRDPGKWHRGGRGLGQAAA